MTPDATRSHLAAIQQPRARSSDSRFRHPHGGPGLDYVFARFKPRLERELGQELSDCIFVTNPARAFALRPSPTKSS